MTRLFRNIIWKLLIIVEFIFGVILLIVWSLLYPFLRLRYNANKVHKSLPSVILFRWFIWSTNIFRYDYFKK